MDVQNKTEQNDTNTLLELLLKEITELKQKNQTIQDELVRLKELMVYNTQLSNNAKCKLDSLLLRSVAKDSVKKSNQINVLFILHNMYTWSSLKTVYDELKKRDNVNVFVVAATGVENKANPVQASYTSKIVDYLKQENIPFKDINFSNVDDVVAFLSSVSPDLVIRQSPWDADLPAVYSSLNLSGFKTVYIPYYTVDIVDFQLNGNDMEVNQSFHLHCHKMYFPSQDLLNRAKLRFKGDSSNFKFLGNTKLEYLVSKLDETAREDDGKLHLLWAPHHSIRNEWLAFGTFENIWEEMIRLAVAYQDKLHICLRPHPILIEKLKMRFNPGLWEEFQKTWNLLPNTSIDNDWDYTKSFNWSDLILTDGISFLVEYPFTGKAGIFIENPNHQPFTVNGELGKACFHTISSGSEIEPLLKLAFENKLSPKLEDVARLKRHLEVENAAKKIVDDLLSDFALDGVSVYRKSWNFY